MCGPVALAAAAAFTAFTQIKGGADAARAGKMNAANNTAINEYNAQQLDRQANDATQRGSNAAFDKRDQIRRFNATARAEAGSSGFLADEGNYGDVNVDNTGIGEQDALTIMNNAEREAYGYKAQATGLRFQSKLGADQASYEGRMAKENGLLGAASTLVNGAAQYGKATNSFGWQNTGGSSAPIKWDKAGQMYGKKIT